MFSPESGDYVMTLSGISRNEFRFLMSIDNTIPVFTGFLWDLVEVWLQFVTINAGRFALPN
jgi:hypothetical protein